MKLERIEMAQVNISVKLPKLYPIKARMGQASKKAEYAMATQILANTDPFVPASQSKSLANRAYVDPKDNSVVYPGPYAHYLYVGKLMVDPATGSPWASYGTTKVYTDKTLNISKAVNPRATDHWFEASKAINKEKWVRVAGRAIQHEF